MSESILDNAKLVFKGTSETRLFLDIVITDDHIDDLIAFINGDTGTQVIEIHQGGHSAEIRLRREGTAEIIRDTGFLDYP